MLELRYGRGAFALPSGLRADLLQPRRADPPAGETGAVLEALDHPIGAPPLSEIVRPGERVAVIVNDITRMARTDLMLPAVVETLHRAGIPDDRIQVIFALGNHRAHTEDERRRIVGEAMYRRLPLADHNAFDETALVKVGTTSSGNVIRINRTVWEADRIILTGEIIYHQIAGYSGGRKSLLPGVAAADSITYNHRMLLDPRCSSGVLAGNPAHEDMLEACRMIDPDFLLNVVLNTDGSLAHAVAGHFEQAHLEGCRVVDALLGVPVPEPYDLILASSGGDPLDIDLRQAHKGLENACRALRPGGTMVYLAECRNGSGHRSTEEYLRRFDDFASMERELRRNFVVGAHKAWWLARLGATYDIRLVSSLDADLVRRCGFQPCTPDNLEALLDDVLAAAGPRVAVVPHAGWTLPLPAPAAQALS